jgi:hypothetical protein
MTMHILASASTIAHLALRANPYKAQPQPTNQATPQGHVKMSATAQRRLHTTEAEERHKTSTEAEHRALHQTPDPSQALEPREQRAVEELRKRDREVRTHELAHLLAAGPHATGGPRFTYTIGPDGQRYAVGGEVPIDVSPVPGDPEATIPKAATIRRAAMAPAHPSPADLTIAAQATAMMAQAHQELLKARNENGAVAQNARPSDSLTTIQDSPRSAAEQSDQTNSLGGPNCQLHGANRDLTEQPPSTRAESWITTAVPQVYQQPTSIRSRFSVTV